MTLFKMRGRKAGGEHFKLDVFVGPDAEHYALAGTLVFRREEYLAFVLRVLGARGLAEFAEIESEVEIERTDPR